MSKFYEVRHLSLEQKRTIMRRAKEHCREWWADILDCSKSFHRQRIDADFEDVLAMLNDKCHFTIIYRDNPWEVRLEIAFSTLSLGPDYFLWIILDPEWRTRLNELGYE